MNKSIAFLLLIGGRSTRYGTDKGISEFRGKPLISYQLDVLSEFEHAIFIVAHSPAQVKNYMKKIEYESITAFIVDDLSLISNKDVRSPMIGIYSGLIELKKIGFDKVFVISCDMPLIKKDVVKLMMESVEGYDCCIPRWKNGYLEPLFAIYPLENTLVRAEENLRQGKYKVLNLLSSSWKINYISVDHKIQLLDEELLTFTNINKPKDLILLKNVFKESEI